MPAKNANTTNPTIVYLIGTSHAETPNVKKGDLYKAIYKARPDLILFELDSSLFEKDFRFPKALLNFFEISVVDSFLKKNPKVLVRPFDITGRNTFFIRNHYFEEEGNFFTRLNDLYQKDSLLPQNKTIHEALVTLDKLARVASAAPLSTVNSAVSDSIIATKMNWYYEHFGQLARSTPELTQYAPHFVLDSTFWIRRNEAMAQNINQFAGLYKGKTIVVITGHFHRYFLKKLLAPKQNETGFILKELYQ